MMRAMLAATAISVFAFRDLFEPAGAAKAQGQYRKLDRRDVKAAR